MTAKDSAPDPVTILVELRDQLPSGHHDRPGVVRSIEVLRHATTRDLDVIAGDLEALAVRYMDARRLPNDVRSEVLRRVADLLSEASVAMKRWDES